jgi:hypothetical protein
MLTESNSPFDQALSKPFLDEPARKKWSISKPLSWFGDHASGSDEEDSDYESVCFASDEEDIESAPLLRATSTKQQPSISSRDKNSPFDQLDDELIFDQVSPGKYPIDANPNSCTCTLVNTTNHPLELSEQDEEQGVLLMTQAVVFQQSPADVDLAILRERESELNNIASSMRQIHVIQQGKFVKPCVSLEKCLNVTLNIIPFLLSRHPTVLRYCFGRRLSGIQC